MVFYKYIKVWYFSSKPSKFLVLAAISIFNDLTLDIRPPWTGPPSLIEFHSIDN